MNLPSKERNWIAEQNIALNRIYKKTEEVYHEYAAGHGFSDVSMWILYTLWERDGEYTQNELASMWCVPKQTINFAISRLVKAGYIVLEQMAVARNSKAVRLTPAGEQLCREKVEPLIAAEHRVLLRMTGQEREQLFHLLEKQYLYLKEELETGAPVLKEGSETGTLTKEDQS